MIIRPFEPADQPAVIALWRRCDLIRPWNDPQKDIARKGTVQPELFLVAEAEGALVGTVMAGYEGHRGWVNYLAVDPDMRRGGLGRILMQRVEQELLALECPKVQLQIRKENVEVIRFYKRLGYVEDPVLSFGKRLIADD